MKAKANGTGSSSQATTPTCLKQTCPVTNSNARIAKLGTKNKAACRADVHRVRCRQVDFEEIFNTSVGTCIYLPTIASKSGRPARHLW